MPRIPIIHQLIASGFGSGYSPIAPGTAGAFLAMLIWWAYATLLNDSHLVFLCTLSFVIIFTVLGTWSASVAEKYWGKDPSKVVIDEMVGTWIALLAVTSHLQWGYMLAAFLLFRLRNHGRRYFIRNIQSDHLICISIHLHLRITTHIRPIHNTLFETT